jgi:undecaprenyl-diphosphatase
VARGNGQIAAAFRRRVSSGTADGRDSGEPRGPKLLTYARALDDALMSRAVQTRSPRLDRPIVALSRAADNSRLWLGLALGLAAIGGPRGRRAAGRGVVAIALASATANGPMKLLVPRRRPPSKSLAALVRTPSSSSFPSGHSASAFAFATAVGGELPVLGPVLVPLAAIVAYSRVHTGVHYPSDVAAGLVVGVACGTVARRIGRPPEVLR